MTEKEKTFYWIRPSILKKVDEEQLSVQFFTFHVMDQCIMMHI